MCVYIQNPDMYRNTHTMGYGRQGEPNSEFKFAVSKVLLAASQILQAL